MRHGFGYTTFRHDSLGLRQETTVFMAPDEPVKFIRLRLKTQARRPRKLTLFTFQHWLLGTLLGESDQIATEFDVIAGDLGRNPQRDLYRKSIAFSTVVSGQDRCRPIAHFGPGELLSVTSETWARGRRGRKRAARWPHGRRARPLCGLAVAVRDPAGRDRSTAR